MKIFELHFNPSPREDLIFDSFCYEPENIYEKRLGSLLVVGELKNALPQNVRFFDNLANFLKKQYYSSPVKFSPETSLRECLKKSNEFLEKIVKSGDVSWLGNLNSVVLALTPHQKKWWGVNFTKTGDIKILLLRAGGIIDMGKNLEFQDIEPYPLKIFGNIVSGKLVEGDMVLVLTKDIFSVFAESQNIPAAPWQKSKKEKGSTGSLRLIEQIAQITASNGDEERKLKEILKSKEKELLRVSGICLLCILTKEVWSEEKKPKIFSFQKEAERFSILQVFYPAVKEINLFFTRRCARVINEFKILKSGFSKALTKLKEATKKLLKFKKPETEPKTKKPRIKISLRHFRIELSDNLKKNLISVFLLFFFLILGFFIFKREEETKLKKYQITLTTVRENISQADNFLFLKNEGKAFNILKEARQKILPLAERKSAIQKEAISLKNSLEEKLEKVSKLEKISNPELFFEFNQKEFIPQKMIRSGRNLYFYNSFAENIYKLTPGAEKNVFKTDQKFSEAASINNTLLFFKKPGMVFLLKGERFEQPLSLETPYPDFIPNDFTIFQSNLYFLDGKNGEIIKYPYLGNLEWGPPQIWLKPNEAKPAPHRNGVSGAGSMAIDGSVWILNDDNTISRYFGGEFQNSLTLDFFPFLKDLSKIASQSEFLYLLEPVQKRLIVLNKTGEIQKQFQSEEFDNLKDFAVSENDRIIWLLNGTKIYKILLSTF